MTLFALINHLIPSASDFSISASTNKSHEFRIPEMTSLSFGYPGAKSTVENMLDQNFRVLESVMLESALKREKVGNQKKNYSIWLLF